MITMGQCALSVQRETKNEMATLVAQMPSVFPVHVVQKEDDFNCTEAFDVSAFVSMDEDVQPPPPPQPIRSKEQICETYRNTMRYGSLFTYNRNSPAELQVRQTIFDRIRDAPAHFTMTRAIPEKKRVYDPLFYSQTYADFMGR